MNELRIWVAMRLATDLDACRSLLLGEPVDPARLDQAELEFMKAMKFATMNFSAIEFFEAQLRDAA